MRFTLGVFAAFAEVACAAQVTPTHPTQLDGGASVVSDVGTPDALDEFPTCEPRTFVLRGRLGGIAVDEVLHPACGGFVQVGPGGLFAIPIECADASAWPPPAPYRIFLPWSGQITNTEVASIDGGTVTTEPSQPMSGVQLRTGLGSVFATGPPDSRFILRNLTRADNGAAVEGQLYGCWRWIY